MNARHISGSKDVWSKLLGNNFPERGIVDQATATLSEQRSGWGSIGRETYEVAWNDTPAVAQRLLLRIKWSNEHSFDMLFSLCGLDARGSTQST